MKIKTYKLPLMAAISAVLLLGISSCSNGSSNNAPTQRPNIIYILADDLGYGDLSFLGQTKFSTPNIDKLAANGMVFTQHYSGATVCAPSRSALMTGMHTGHTQVRGNRGLNDGQFPLAAGSQTLAGVLKKAGYTTGAFGKWGLGYPGSSGAPLNQGFDVFFGFNSQTIAHNYYPRELWDNDKIISLEGNQGTEQGQYAPNLIQEKRLEFIEANKDTSFFMFVPTIIPHAELFAPEEYMEKFLTKTNPEPPYQYESKLGPETFYKGVDDPEHPRYKVGGYGSQAYPHAAFAAMVTLLDDHVGEIVAKLDELNILENTVIVFTSDNGPHLEGGADPDFFNSNGPFQGYKRDLLEGGIHVPMILSWPAKVKKGSQTDHISAFWDILPTFSALVDEELEEPIDGISFLPTLLGEGGQPTHSHLYWEFHEKGGKQAVRKGKWKGIKREVFKGNETILLYNLEEDPGETTDLAQDHPDVVKEIKLLMEKSRVEDPEWPFDAKIK
ncbi:arylsulfatase [Cyclobacterium marinum]|uniref:arylsulfatase n=1 Tax=Cyclobacterium marinum TaxID=104 RepID=UPI0011EBF3FB|nr:arylsulfatase [Cyclobacterium marinum]MBI0397178.1 arylsulfatase [Cyclobacterium marinum]